MKVAELRAMTMDELRRKEEEIKKEILTFRFQKALGRLDSPAKYKRLRRDLARVKTLIREKGLGRI